MDKLNESGSTTSQRPDPAPSLARRLFFGFVDGFVSQLFGELLGVLVSPIVLVLGVTAAMYLWLFME
jgi:hypothetical protein